MIPARAELRAARVVGAFVNQRDVLQSGRESGPALIEQGRPARREAGGDKVERVGLQARCEARSGHAEEFAVDDGQIVARREAVGRVQDVGLAPTHELLADLEGERAARERGVEAPDGEAGPFQRSVAPADAVPLRLAVRVSSRVDAARQPKPTGRPGRRLVPQQRLADQLRRVVRRGLRIPDPQRLDEALLGEHLRVGAHRCQQEKRQRCCRDRVHCWGVLSSCFLLLASGFLLLPTVPA